MDEKEAAKAAKKAARENAAAERKATYEAKQAALKEKAAGKYAANRAKMAELEAKHEAANEERKRNLAEAFRETKESAIATKTAFKELASSVAEVSQTIGDMSNDLAIKAPLGDEKRQEIRDAAGSDKKLVKSMLRDAKKAEKARAEAERLELFGERIADVQFWTRRICIYEKGYVSVRMLIGSPNFDKPERLKSISSTSQVFDKSFWTDSLQGDLYLTIVTEHQTYALNHPQANTGDVRRMKGLVATAQSVIGSGAAPTAQKTQTGNDSNTELSGELTKLNALHTSGVLTEAEFTAAKAKLLGL